MTQQPDWHERNALVLHEVTTKTIPVFSDNRLIVVMVIIPADEPNETPTVVSNINKEEVLPDILVDAANSISAALNQGRVVVKQAK